MKLKNYFWLISMAMFVGLSLTLTACGGDDDDDDPIQEPPASSLTVNGLQSTDLEFPGAFENKSGIDYKLTVRVESNVTWSISDKPDWLSISPLNGNGTVDITIYPTSENTTSSTRTATITLNGNGMTATINVKQNAGKPVCYVDISDEVVLYNQTCWEYSATGDVNKFQVLMISENEYQRLTDKELEEEVIKTEEMKIGDEPLSWRWFDSNYNYIQPNSTYYVITLASDASGKYGELRKKKLTTPSSKDSTDDAWVSFDNLTGYLDAFTFDTKKEGYCNTYHIIYGALPSYRNYYIGAVYAFEINYYIKHKKKHWLAERYKMEIVTDYPNNHTFVCYQDKTENPLCFAYAWGIFKDGTLSSDIVGFQVDRSEGSVMQKVSKKSMQMSNQKKENITITRSEIEKIVKK